MYDLLEEINKDKFAAEKVELQNANILATVQNYSPSEFEQFILEYLLFVKREDIKIKRIFKIGKSGDHGIDIYLIDEDEKKWYYQCKHYKKSLSVSDVNSIILKIFAYIVKGIIDKPKKIYIVGLNDVSPKAAAIFDNEKQFRDSLNESIGNALKQEKIELSDAERLKLSKIINTFALDDIEFLYINTIVSEYYYSHVGKLRFDNNIKFEKKKVIEQKNEDLNFYNQLTMLQYESEEERDYLLKQSLESYYCALSIKFTDEYYFKSTENFDDFVDDIFIAEQFALIRGCKTIRDVESILENSTHVITTKSFLDRRLHLIGSAEKQGACHYIVENEKGWWKK